MTVLAGRDVSVFDFWRGLLISVIFLNNILKKKKKTLNHFVSNIFTRKIVRNIAGEKYNKIFKWISKYHVSQLYNI